MSFGQVSFISDINPGGKLRMVSAPLVLSNGNIFVSTRMDSFPEVEGPEFNTVFLFDKCGNLITSKKIVDNEEDVRITHFIENTEGNIICRGYFLDNYFFDFFIVLHKEDLSEIQRKKFYSVNYLTDYMSLDDGVIYEYSATGDIGFSQLKESSLSRKFYLFNDEYNEDVRFINFSYATNDIMCHTKSYYSENFFTSYSYHCVDKYLEEKYSINEGTNEIVFTIFGQPIHLGEEVILMPSNYTDLQSEEQTFVINKYNKDSLIFSRPVEFDDKFLGRYGQCFPTGEKIHCINQDASIQQFNYDGEWIGENTNLTDTLTIDDLNHSVMTDDNAIVAATANWIYDEEAFKWTSYLRLIKTNSDFDIPSTSIENCSVATEDLSQLNTCSLYPNPSWNGFTVKSEIPIKRFTLTTQAGKVIITKQNIQALNNISFEKLDPGFYLLDLETINNDNIQKKVIAIE